MLAILRALFGQLVDIFLLRRGPEHLPASRTLLGAFVVMHIVVFSVAEQIFFGPPVPGVPSLNWLGQIVVAAIMLLWFRIALRLAGKPERFLQTMTAVFFTSLLAVVLVPLSAALLPYALAAQKSPTEAVPAPAALLLLTALAGFWILAMLARIVKSAFEWTWPATIVFVMMSTFGVPLLLKSIFGIVPSAT